MKINFLNQNSKWKESLQSGFDTKRLKIRTLTREDLANISKISNDKNLFVFVADIENGDGAETWIKSVYQKRNYLFFSIKGKNIYSEPGGILFGILMLNRDSDSKIEIGGWFGTEFQGRGYGSELVKGLVSYVKKNKPGLQLYAEIHKENLAALKALEGSGVKQKINP